MESKNLNQMTATLVNKLTSRKFVGAVIGVLMGIYLIAFESDVTTGATLIAACVCGYNFAEAYVDGKSAAASTVTVTASTTSKDTVEKLINE